MIKNAILVHSLGFVSHLYLENRQIMIKVDQSSVSCLVPGKDPGKATI